MVVSKYGYRSGYRLSLPQPHVEPSKEVGWPGAEYCCSVQSLLEQWLFRLNEINAAWNPRVPIIPCRQTSIIWLWIMAPVVPFGTPNKHHRSWRPTRGPTTSEGEWNRAPGATHNPINPTHQKAWPPQTPADGGKGTDLLAVNTETFAFPTPKETLGLGAMVSHHHRCGGLDTALCPVLGSVFVSNRIRYGEDRDTETGSGARRSSPTFVRYLALSISFCPGLPSHHITPTSWREKGSGCHNKQAWAAHSHHAPLGSWGDTDLDLGPVRKRKNPSRDGSKNSETIMLLWLSKSLPPGRDLDVSVSTVSTAPTAQRRSTVSGLSLSRRCLGQRPSGRNFSFFNSRSLRSFSMRSSNSRANLDSFHGSCGV